MFFPFLLKNIDLNLDLEVNNEQIHIYSRTGKIKNNKLSCTNIETFVISKNLLYTFVFNFIQKTIRINRFIINIQKILLQIINYLDAIIFASFL